MDFLFLYLTAVAAVIFAAAAFACPLITTYYKAETDRLRPGDVLRVALIADLHSTRFGKNQARLLSEIKMSEPDIILLSGDIFDDRRPSEPVLELLSVIDKLEVPAYYVAGNHEANSKRTEEFAQKARSLGIKALGRTLAANIDERVMTRDTLRFGGRKIVICGICDPYLFGDNEKWRDAAKAEFADIADDGGLRLLACHRPEEYELYASLGFDASFSGHAHGGQVRLPFLREGLIAPHQGKHFPLLPKHIGIFPKFTSGAYKIPRPDGGELIHIVSRGLSIFPTMPRIFNPPELVCVTFHGIEAARDESDENAQTKNRGQ